MKLLIGICGALAAAFAPLAVMAQDAGGDVLLEGSVAPRCAFRTPDTVLLDLGELSVRAGAPSELGRLDPSRLTSRTATLNAWCNTGTAQLTVQADPLENTSAADTLPGFERRIDFTATATATGPETAAKDSTLTDGPGAAVNGGVGTELLVSFSDVSTPADARLLAGPYAGAVAVMLTPIF